MKGFLAITTTVAFLGMFAVTTSAQRVTGVGSTPGYYNSQPTTPGINSANRRYDPPRDYRTPPPSYNDKYGRNDPYRHDRDDRDRRGSDCDDDRRGGYGSRDDDRRGEVIMAHGEMSVEDTSTGTTTVTALVTNATITTMMIGTAGQLLPETGTEVM